MKYSINPSRNLGHNRVSSLTCHSPSVAQQQTGETSITGCVLNFLFHLIFFLLNWMTNCEKGLELDYIEQENTTDLAESST